MKTVFVSNLFPNSFDHARGLFSINQLRAMRDAGYAFKVVAPVASFPLFRSHWAEEAGRLPARESYDGFDVYHPKAWYLPRNRGAVNARLYRWSVRDLVERLCREHEARLLWGSFAFPDGVATGDIATALGLPYVVSLLGSDINQNVAYPGRRRAIAGSLRQASVVLAKSRALRDIVVDLGVEPDRVVLDYNGVDQETFRPILRDEACAACGVDPARRRILFVGNFVRVKNIPTLIAAFATVAGAFDSAAVDLVLVGNGALRSELLHMARARSVRDRIIMPGSLRHDQVATWMGACDVLCLPSWNEGVPNVVLEGLASGLPVVASNVGGIPEVHPGDSAGGLFPPDRADLLAGKLIDTLSRDWDRRVVAGNVSRYTWRQNAENVIAAFERLLPAPTGV